MTKIFRHNTSFEGKPGQVVSFLKGEEVPGEYADLIGDHLVEEGKTVEASGSEETPAGLGDGDLTKSDLQDILRSRGLAVSGNVEALKARIAEDDEARRVAEADGTPDFESMDDEALKAAYVERTGDREERSREEILAVLDSNA